MKRLGQTHLSHMLTLSLTYFVFYPCLLPRTVSKHQVLLLNPIPRPTRATSLPLHTTLPSNAAFQLVCCQPNNMTPLPLLQMAESLRGFLLAAELQILWPLGLSKMRADCFWFFWLCKYLRKVRGGRETIAACVRG